MNVRDRRKTIDINQIISNGYQIYYSAGGTDEIFVIFHGRDNTTYQGGIWKLRIRFPPHYPYKGPIINFMNKIFHPNIESKAGTICLNLIGSDWSPTYDLLSVLNIFLPELLENPNARDPYNSEAAKLYNESTTKYTKTVREYIIKYASSLEDLIPKENEFKKDFPGFGFLGSDDDDDVMII